MWVVDLLLPHRCPVCRAPGPAPCAVCLADLPAAPALPPPPGVDRCAAAVAYAGDGRALVADLKFGGRRGATTWAAARLCRQLGGERPDVVTWVPAAPAHRRRRGADPAEVLARAVARRFGVPARRLLRRGAGPAQGDKDAAARRLGPPLAAAGPAPPSVLLVDDVVTTGGSVAAAARHLRRAGATRVVVAALARTPR